jgi:hypothetical protein
VSVAFGVVQVNECFTYPDTVKVFACVLKDQEALVRTLYPYVPGMGKPGGSISLVGGMVSAAYFGVVLIAAMSRVDAKGKPAIMPKRIKR